MCEHQNYRQQYCDSSRSLTQSAGEGKYVRGRSGERQEGFEAERMAGREMEAPLSLWNAESQCAQWAVEDEKREQFHSLRNWKENRYFKLDYGHPITVIGPVGECRTSCFRRFQREDPLLTGYKVDNETHQMSRQIHTRTTPRGTD